MSNHKFSTRLSVLRINAGYTQKTFADELTRRVERERTISPLTISAYENGTKTPPLNVLVGIADIFNVTTDYLLGIGDMKTPKATEETDSPMPTYDILIRPQEYQEYDRQPVFVTFDSNMDYPDQWGILDYEKNRVVMARVIFPISNNISLHRFTPIDSLYTQVTNLQPLTIVRLSSLTKSGEPSFKVVWVEMQGRDDYIKGRYNGWYINDVQNGLLINKANNLILKHEGCGISFNAYNLDR